MLIAPYNNIEAVAGLVREHLLTKRWRMIILEPFQRIIPPAPGFCRRCAS